MGFVVLYLPVDPKCDVENPPVIEVDAPNVAAIMRAASENQEENQEDNGGWGHREQDPRLEAGRKFHTTRPGWMEIMSLSHGCSQTHRISRGGTGGSGSMSDLSMMKYFDLNSPQMTVMCMGRELLPHGVLRLVDQVDEEKGTFTVVEMMLQGAQITSIQTSGSSGGLDTMTESLSLEMAQYTVRFLKIKLEDGTIVSDSSGFWDLDAKKGQRDGFFAVPRLKSLASKALEENQQLYEPRQLLKLPKALREDLSLNFNPNQFKVPVRGRRLLFTREEPKKGDRCRFKEIYVRDLTLNGLKAAATARFGAPAKGLFQFEGTMHTMVEVTVDAQCQDVSDGSLLHVVF